MTSFFQPFIYLSLSFLQVQRSFYSCNHTPKWINFYLNTISVKLIKCRRNHRNLLNQERKSNWVSQGSTNWFYGPYYPVITTGRVGIDFMLGPSSPTQKSKPEPTSPASSASSSDWVRGDRGNNPGINAV